MSKECTTHHFACECREEKFKKLEQENAALRSDVYQCPPTSENDYEGFKWRDACEELERENAALREDKERLDWLLTGDGGLWVNWMYEKDEWTPELKASRDAIDACRNRRIGNGRQP